MVFFDEIKLLQGVFILIFISITLIVAITIGLKYFKNREVEYILIGITWVGLASPWVPDAICFVANLIFPSISLWYINEFWYLITGMAFLPLFLVLWLMALKKLVYHERGKQLILINITIGIVYDLAFFILLFLDITQIATINPSDMYTVDLGIIMMLYIPYMIILFVFTGLHFSYLSLKSENPEVILRAKMLILAIILFAIGAFLDSVITAILPTIVIITFIAKVILILSSILFYISFVLPNWAKKRFIK